MEVKILTTPWVTCNKTLTKDSHISFCWKGKHQEKKIFWRQKEFKQLLPEGSAWCIEELINYMQVKWRKGAKAGRCFQGVHTKFFPPRQKFRVFFSPTHSSFLRISQSPKTLSTKLFKSLLRKVSALLPTPSKHLRFLTEQKRRSPAIPSAPLIPSTHAVLTWRSLIARHCL